MSDRLPAEVLARRTSLPRKPAPVVLAGARVELRPLDLDAHLPGLHAVSCGAPFALGDRRCDAYDPDERIWCWMKGGPFDDAAALGSYLAAIDAAPDTRALTVIDRATGAPLGVAFLLASTPADMNIELGSLW
ncbi:MAG: hypothetical protein ACTHU0_31505 [Kofleriaceae bacterium]